MARPLAFLILVSGLTLGCQSSGKKIPPKDPYTPFVPAKAAAAPTAKATTMTATPSRSPIINNAPTPPAPSMPALPGTQSSAISAPTLPGVSQAAPPPSPVVAQERSILPVPPSPPGESGAVPMPVGSGIAMPNLNQ